MGFPLSQAKGGLEIRYEWQLKWILQFGLSHLFNEAFRSLLLTVHWSWVVILDIADLEGPLAHERRVVKAI